MLRFALFVTACAGCDLVFTVPDRARPSSGLHESETHDEDGDGTVDAFDACPHLPGSQVDYDGDGIGDDCDPHPFEPIDERYFASFENGSTEGMRADGLVTPEADAVLLGSAVNGYDGLLLPIDVATAAIDVGFEMTQNAFEPPFVMDVSYAELGIAAVHREYSSDHKKIGDTCFFGRDRNIDSDYIQFNEDEVYLGEFEHRWTGALVGVSGRAKLERTNLAFRCEMPRPGAGTVADGYTRDEARALTGSIAIWTTHVQIRLRYLYVVIPRPSPASP